jgi:hypothetical protein
MRRNPRKILTVFGILGALLFMGVALASVASPGAAYAEGRDR